MMNAKPLTNMAVSHVIVRNSTSRFLNAISVSGPER